MEEVLRAFGLYDLVGYFVPGAVALWAILVAINAYPRPRAMRPRVPHQLAFVVGAYILGQLLQAVVSPSREWKALPPFQQTIANVYSKHPKFGGDLLATANRAFHDPDPQDPKEVFRLAEAYVQVRNLDSFLQIMQARYAFFRGLSISLLVASLALALAAYWSRPEPLDETYLVALPRGYERLFVFAIHTDSHDRPGRGRALIVIAAVVCFLGIPLSWVRANDFAYYYSDAVYRTFYIDYTAEEAGAKRATVVSNPARP